MRCFQSSLFFLYFCGVLTSCTTQAVNAMDFYPISYPGEISLFYANRTWINKDGETYFKVAINNKVFHIFGEAVKPSIQSVFLLENSIINRNEDVLDIGTGSGIQAIFAAEKARHVVATDIGKDAVKSTIINVKRFGLSKMIDVRLGDLFEPLQPGEKFDVIINNINYPEEEDAEKNENNSLWKVHERFFREVKQFLKPGGRIYYQSGFIFNIPRIQKLIVQNDLQIMQMKMITSIPYRKELIFYVAKHKAY